jgi:hypothetical protein
MGFKEDQWKANDAYGDYDFEPGSHMFLKVADFGEYAICVQSNTSPKTSPPLVLIHKSVYQNGRGGSHISMSDVYVMLDDMGLSCGRKAPPDEINTIRVKLAANIEGIRFYRIERTDNGYEYTLVSGKAYDTLVRALVEALHGKSV